MGMHTKLTHLKESAFRLRASGKSYREIQKLLGISSRGTLSYWFRNLRLSEKARKRLEANAFLAWARGLTAFNERRSKSIVAENKRIFDEASNSIRDLSQKDLLLIGAALYWGEGTLRGGKHGFSVAFSNSNPDMIQVFMKFIRNILGVTENRIRVGAYIHPNINYLEAVRFWSKITKLPVSNFHVVRQVSKSSKMIRSPNFLPYGTLHIKVNSRQHFYRVKGYIDGIARELIS